MRFPSMCVCVRVCVVCVCLFVSVLKQAMCVPYLLYTSTTSPQPVEEWCQAAGVDQRRSDDGSNVFSAGIEYAGGSENFSLKCPRVVICEL